MSKTHQKYYSIVRLKKQIIKFSVVLLFLFTSHFSFTQNQTQFVDFKTADVHIMHISKAGNSVKGKVIYTFDVLKPIDSLYLDSKNINGYIVSLNKDENVVYYTDENKFWLIKHLEPSTNNVLSLTFEANPKKTIYAVGWNGDNHAESGQIWTQGQGKYTSNWLPSFDDVNEKVKFNISVTFDKNYCVLANGKLIKKAESDSTSTWHYTMKQPMPSYLVALAIGKYKVKKETSKSDIPLEMYYYPEDSLKLEPTYRYTKQMFNFLEAEIGFPYPWQNYKQVPVHDFLYGGMENTSLTIFSDAFVVDSIAFNDKNYVNVNAHELAHQWFGNLVTATSGEHHWLQEGFATYYALLAEKHVFGEDYFHFKLLQTAQDLAQQEFAKKGTSLLNPKSSSLTFYQRGAWVLYMLRQKVGDMVFKQAIKNYLQKHQYASVQTQDFIVEVEKLHGKPLTAFVNKWIKNKAFPYEDAVQNLYKNSVFIQEYIEIDCEAKASKCEHYLSYYASDEAKAKVIAQQPNLITKDAFKNGLKVRQAISQHLRYVPKHLKAEYESLLNDKSYITIENALYNLWTSFPLERSKYLHKTKHIEGFSDKNIKLLWLVLCLNTPEYKADDKAAIFEELVSYTSQRYNADVRMNAFNYLKLMKACNATCISNLKDAKTHHNWRMTKFAKDMLDQLNQNP